jgi:arabinogalactan endo-1,4-beta-galactosidase
MFLKGVDISSLKEVEDQGGSFYCNKTKKDALEILKSCGVNSVRLRLWVDPYDENGLAYGGGTCDINTVIGLSKRAKNLDMSVLLDFHYSDFWTDPSKQYRPKSWQNLNFEQLKNKIYQYTKDTLLTLKDCEIEPEFIQIGNEITCGMLWDDGKLVWNDKDITGFDNLAALLKSGVQGAKEVLKDAKIILHLERSGDNTLYRQWFDNIISRGVEFDIIGVSYYLYWHGSMDDMIRNLEDITLRYDKDVLIAETSYAYTLKDFDKSLQPQNYTKLIINKNTELKNKPYPFSQKGQAKFLKDLFYRVKNLNSGRCLGVYYWEPCWIPIKSGTWASKSAREYIKELHKGEGNEWANQALFDYDGNINYALKILNKL